MRPEVGRELRLLAAALAMQTALPVHPGPLPADRAARSAKYLPLVGILVGAGSAASLWVAAELWPPPIPALFGLAAALLLTRARHETGLARAADAQGGQGRAAQLAIMRDARLGTFGVLALAGTLALKLAALGGMAPAAALPALVASAALSRALAVVVAARTTDAGERPLAELDHGIEGPRTAEVSFALLPALLSLLLVDMAAALAGLGLAALVAILAAVRLCRPLGGHTGEVLGAVIVLSETAFLVGAAARWG